MTSVSRKMDRLMDAWYIYDEDVMGAWRFEVETSRRWRKVRRSKGMKLELARDGSKLSQRRKLSLEEVKTSSKFLARMKLKL